MTNTTEKRKEREREREREPLLAHSGDIAGQNYRVLSNPCSDPKNERGGTVASRGFELIESGLLDACTAS